MKDRETCQMTRLGCELQWAVEIQEIQPSVFNTKNNKGKKKGGKKEIYGSINQGSPEKQNL